MNVKRIVVAAFSALCLLSGVAVAGTMHNNDDHEYEIYKSSSGGGVHTSIGAHTTQMSTCSYFPCTIKLVKTGQTIKLTSDKQNVEISGGKISIK